MEDNKKFEIEVLTRLTKIETLLEDFKGVEAKANEAYNLSKGNEKRIEKMQEKNQWLFRTCIGTILTTLISIGFALIRG